MNVRFKTAIEILGDEKSKGLQLAMRQGSPLISRRTGLGGGAEEGSKAGLGGLWLPPAASPVQGREPPSHRQGARSVVT